MANGDPSYSLLEEERARLSDVLAKEIVEINHFGSTSVPDLAAKPIIDIQGGTSTHTTQISSSLRFRDVYAVAKTQLSDGEPAPHLFPF